MKELNTIVRRDTILGSSKVIVGDKFSDLVLETLGKVYIKSGRQLKLLSDIVEKVSTTSDLKNKTIIVNSISELENIEYPGEGYFIFNTTTGILYISLNNKYIALVNASEFSESGYVKKSGDIMTGPLEIKSDDANLIISNNKIIKNLNSSYLNGFTDLDFAKRNKDEKINGNWSIEGKWSFNKPTVFNENIRSKKDYITDGNLSSPEFASGFSGYGWRLDASTNTFTIDNLVVRKVMMVYEMVINKIMATNGSLWVSNSSKIESVKQVRFIYPGNEYYLENSYSKVPISNGFINNEYYLFGKSASVSAYNLSSSTTINKIDGDATKRSLRYKPTRLQYLNNSSIKISQDDSEKYFIEDENPEIYDINNDNLFNSGFIADIENTNVQISTYFKYFSTLAEPEVNNCYVIETDKEEYPMFRDGDILRCQKYTEGNIKYYDAVVLKHIKERHYLIQVAESVFDKYTKIEYDEKGNLINSTEEYNETLYNKTNKVLNPSTGEYIYKSKSYENTDGSYNGESSLYKPQKGDDLIQIGNIYNTDRQGALYLTATDDQGPYMDILDGINRPDYSVLYKTGDKYSKPTKVRLGKLDGIYNSIFENNQPHGYGLYGENVYLTGEFYLSNGKSVASFAEDIQLIVGDLDSTITEKVKEQTNVLKEDFVQHDDLENAGMYIGNDSIVLWADAIKIATEKADIDNPNKYTALFSDGKLSAQVFEAVAYADKVYNPKLKINDDIGYLQILGCKGEKINTIEGPPSSNTNIGIYHFKNDGILQFVVDKQSLKGSNPGLIIGDNKLFYDGIYITRSEDRINTLLFPEEEIRQITFIIKDGSNTTTIDDYSERKKNYSNYEYINPYPTLTINKLGNGEIIYYWKSGYIMNCKLFKLNNNTIKGCAEFFFNDNTCELNFVKEGYDSLISKYTTTNNNGEIIGKDGCVKYIDYFTTDPDIQLEAVTTYKWKSFYNSGPGTTDYIKHTSLVSSDLEKANIAKTISDLGFYSEAVVYYRVLNSNTFTYNGIKYDISNYLYKSSPYTICKKLIKNTDTIKDSDYEEWDNLKVKPSDEGKDDVEYVINYTCNRDSSKLVKSGSITSLPISSNGDLTNGWKYKNYFYSSYILDNIINSELI